MQETLNNIHHGVISTRYFDDTFDIENCQNYILSIQLSLNGFSFIVFDPNLNKFIVLVDFELNAATPFQLKVELEHFFKNEAILRRQFKKVRAVYHDLRVLLVPELVLSESDFSSLFYFMFEKRADEQVFANKIQKGETSALFSFPKVISELLKDNFPNAEFLPCFFPFLKFGLNSLSFHPVLYVNRMKNIIQIALIDGQKVVFVNQFFAKSDSDCLYYTLNVAKQLNLDKNTELKLMGKIDPHSEYATSLKNYFEKVHFARFRSHYSVSHSFFKEPDHLYVPFLELCLCEL